MRTLRNWMIFPFVGIFCLYAMSGACAPKPTGEGNNEQVADGGGGDGGGKEKEPAGPIEITFEPASGGQLEVKDVCITVKFSRAPSKSDWTVELKAKGASIETASSFEFDTADKEGKTAKVCPYSLLLQDTEYTLKVSVKEKVEKGVGRTFSGEATYTTKKTFQGNSSAGPGLAVDLVLKEIIAPSGISALLQNINLDDIPPILLTIHSKEQGDKGKLTLVGGLGKAPKGGKAHEGKAIVDTETPVSLALEGNFDGRWFSVGPTTFVLSVAGFNIELTNFYLTGIFSEDGKNIETGRLTGVINSEAIKKKFNIDACLILGDECFKGPNGEDLILVAGKLEGVINPLEYSVFITQPVYLETGVDAGTKVVFYTTAKTKEADVAVKLFTCKGSSDEEKPCDKGKGATLTEVTDPGTVTIDASGQKGEFAPKSLDAATWYKLELESKDEQAKEFKTSVMFKTK